MKSTETAEESSEEEQAVAAAAFQVTSSPFENILNKLKESYTEITVLHDVLSIAKEKHYLCLDPVPMEQTDVKPMAVIYARKKSLGMAGNILISGAERLKRIDNGPDFQIELLRLRQNWRLKKVSDNIIGDLSFRTAGSKFMHPGNFEVSKADETDLKGPNVSSLQVTIPSELQGVAYIKVVTQKDQEDLCSANVSMIDQKGKLQLGEISSWQKKLEFAQNVLFCKEVSLYLNKKFQNGTKLSLKFSAF